MSEREKRLIDANELKDSFGFLRKMWSATEICGIIDAMPTADVTVQKWIPVSERLPEAETEVLVLARCGKHTIITGGIYEDGTKNTEDSGWCWYDHDFKYNEELDAYIIPEGWWEYRHYNGDDVYNQPIDDKLTHWMPLPEPPKECE